MHAKLLILIACCAALRAGSLNAAEPGPMLGCYSLEPGQKPEIHFYLENKGIYWSVLRKSGWQKQPDSVRFYDQTRPHPDIPSHTFEKMEAMLDMGDAFFLIKFRADRLDDVTGGTPAVVRAIGEMKQQGTPYLLGANGFGPVFAVACGDVK